MFIEEELKLDFNDVLIRPQRTNLPSRKDVSLERDFTFLHSKVKYKGVPIIAANMDTVGTMEMAKELSKYAMATALHKHYSVDELIEFYKNNQGTFFYSMGILNNDYEKFKEFNKRAKEENIEANYVCVDVANGYAQVFVNFIRKLRQEFPDIVIMAGNVVTREMTEELLLSGADIVKVGIGPGSACTTRKVAGVGYPQLSAIIECANAAHGLKGLICGDGGCTMPADLSKAFGGGSDFVMLGGMLSGHDESGGQTIEKNGRVYKQFYGMSSKDAMDKYAGGVAEYRASEGRSVLIEHRGPVKDTILSILGGVRSACTYVGAAKLKELSRRTTFVRVNNQTTYNKVYE